MAVSHSNISPLLDLATSPPRLPDRWLRYLPLLGHVVSIIFKKDLHQLQPNLYSVFNSVFDMKERHVSKQKSNQSKLNEVEYENSSNDENGSGLDDEFGGDEDHFDWEEEMRWRVKELEEMKELEKKAKELQYKIDEEYQTENDVEKQMGLKIEPSDSLWNFMRIPLRKMFILSLLLMSRSSILLCCNGYVICT